MPQTDQSLLPTRDDLCKVARLRQGGCTTTLGWGPLLRNRCDYFTPDEYYEAVVSKLVTEGCRWLEVGCGRRLFPNNDALAEALVTRCERVVGVDPDQTIDENPFVTDRIRCDVVTFTSDRPFDVVTLRMVAEHVVRPDAVVASLARLTRPGGCVVVYTVNRRSPLPFLARVISFRYHHFIKKLFWGTEEVDTFPVAYRMNTRKALGELFGTHGFRERSFSYLDDCRTTSQFRALHRAELAAWKGFRWAGVTYPENCLLGVYERLPAAVPSGGRPPIGSAEGTGGVAGHAGRRVILLLGSPRSGTTWLAKILDTHPGVVYRHEPILRMRRGQLKEAVSLLNDLSVEAADVRYAAARDLGRADPDCCRPPFFRKDCLKTPRAAQWLSWFLVRSTRRGARVFGRLLTPDESASYDLLIKEIGISKDLHRWVETLAPETVVLVRHPCAVVASLLRGYRLGLMPLQQRPAWFANHAAFCRSLGFEEGDVLAMDECEFVALEWLVQNHGYQEALAASPRGTVVVYEDLCKEPLKVTQAIFDFLGWEVGRSTRRFLKSSTEDNRFKDLVQGKQSYFGIFKNSTSVSEAWRRELSPDQIQRVLDMVDRTELFSKYFSRPEPVRPS